MTRITSFRRLLCCLLVLLVLCSTVIRPLSVSATATTATVVGVSALCVVGAALIGLGVKPLVESSIDSFESLVNKIVSAMPSDLLVSTYQSSKSTKMIQYGGISYIPKAVIEFVLNYVVANTVAVGFAISSAATQAISEYLAANDVNYERAQECRYLYHISLPDCSYPEVWIWSNDTVELLTNYQNGRYYYSMKCYGPSYVNARSKLDNLLDLDWCEIAVYDETMSYPRTVSLGLSSVDSGTIEMQEKEYTATVDGLALTDTFDTSLASEEYDFWTKNGLTIADTASLPLSVPASIPDTVSKTQTDVVAGTATKAETAVIEDTVSGTDTGTATLGFLDSILSWLEKIWNAVKSLVVGITTPIVNVVQKVVSAVETVVEFLTGTAYVASPLEAINFTGLFDLFPFNIPYGIYQAISFWDAGATAPVITIPLPTYTGGSVDIYEFEIDFSEIPGMGTLVAIIRGGELILFAVGLLMITRKVTKW